MGAQRLRMQAGKVRCHGDDVDRGVVCQFEIAGHVISFPLVGSLRTASAQEFLARIFASRHFLELLEGISSSFRKFGGGLDVGPDEHVALSAGRSPYALAPDTGRPAL